MNETRKLRVFFCCTFQDKRRQLIQETYQRFLDQDWIEPWLDDEKLLPGMSWDVEVEKAVGESDCIIICLSKQAIVDNKYVQRELRFVLDRALENSRHSIFIVPVRLDDCQIPRHIRPWQYYDFSIFEQREQVYQRLLKTLQIRANLEPNINAPGQSAHFVSASDWNEKFGSAPDVLKDFDFMEIPAGKFWMGSKVANPLASRDEIMQRPCHVPYDYCISRFPITNQQFGEFSVTNGRTDLLIEDWRSKPKRPVINVSWNQAVTYVNWLNKVLGKELERGMIFRLPTEAEWERAARGDFGREWPWGNERLDTLIQREIWSNTNSSAVGGEEHDFTGSNEVSDFFARLFRIDDGEFYKVSESIVPETRTQWKFRSKVNYARLKRKIAALRAGKELVDVGAFSPITDSPYRVADMMGTILEWTQSLYEPYPYNAEDGRENLGGDGRRVMRGVFNSADERFSVRCAKRTCAPPTWKSYLLGFRIVIAPVS